MSEQIRAAVSAILESAGVTFSAIYRGERKNALDGTHPMDAWDCAFTRAQAIESNFSPRAGGKTAAHEEFDFFTGFGHRKPDPLQTAALLQQGYKKHMHSAKFDAASKPQAPHTADVLHSIILDSSAATQSFESWCDEFGYDTDSRKAHDTYEACQRNADKLARVFNAAQRAALSEALQDY